MDRMTSKNVPGMFSMSSTLARRDYDGIGKGQLGPNSDCCFATTFSPPSIDCDGGAQLATSTRRNHEAQVRTRTKEKESLQIQSMSLLPVLVYCLETS